MAATVSDEAFEAAVLSHLLVLHPTRLSMCELLREMCPASDDFGERDGCERAARDLIAVGLLRRDGDSIVPTRAALRFDALAA
jgi:hypothetical protein